MYNFKNIKIPLIFAKLITDAFNLNEKILKNNSKIKKFTKWQPKYNLDQGLKETIEWLDNNKKLFKFDIYNQ